MVISIEKFKKHENKWVALDEKTQKVVAADSDIAKVQHKAEKVGSKNIVLKFIYPFDTYLAP